MDVRLAKHEQEQEDKKKNEESRVLRTSLNPNPSPANAKSFFTTTLLLEVTRTTLARSDGKDSSVIRLHSLQPTSLAGAKARARSRCSHR